MILIAVIIGYLLGVAPFIYKEIKEIFQNKTIKEDTENQEDETQQILDEWLNGPREKNNKKNQEDIFNEYITGQESNKEG